MSPVKSSSGTNECVGLFEEAWVRGVIEKLRAGISDNSPKVHFHLSSNSIILPLHLTLILSMKWEQENGG